jgi:hypothetical protein
MADQDLIKYALAFAGAAVGAFTGIYVKEVLERKRLREEELQTRWLPLTEAAERLERKLNDLLNTYNEPGTVVWESQTHHERSLPLLARDFVELFLFDKNTGKIEHFDGLRTNGRRKNREATLGFRERIHELNYAMTAMYATAVY